MIAKNKKYYYKYNKLYIFFLEDGYIKFKFFFNIKIYKHAIQKIGTYVCIPYG